MTVFVSRTTEILALLTILLQGATIVLVIAHLAGFRTLASFFGRHALLLGFLVSVGALGASLFYSDVAGFTPCPLCWWQRVFLYPQAVLFAIALFKRDRGIVDYALVLSIIGGAIALYHTYLQFGGSPLVPCSAETAACVQRFFIEYGYITIPTMSLSAFLFLVALLVVARKFAHGVMR